MKTTTLSSIDSMNRLPVGLALLLIPLALACFALGPQARATCQQGCLSDGNTVLGENALLSNTSSGNTAIGSNALFSNTLGYSNTAIGISALYYNTIGTNNTASGEGALSYNTTGSANTATGAAALLYNTTGSLNTANGDGALVNNTTGIENTASGFDTLGSNTTGSGNAAYGVDALFSNSTGNNNTAEGYSALGNNIAGSSNIALGFQAGMNVTGNDNIDIGNNGVAIESRTIRIGTKQIHRNTYIAGISGATIPTGVPVIVDSSGHLGTTTSSARYKDNILPMDKESEAILGLKPVTFRYKHDLDPDSIPQFGLVAEEVEKVNPDLIVRDEQGKPYTVRYDAVNAMLLNEFLKARHQINAQQKQIEVLTKGLQKVTADIELNNQYHKSH